MNHSGVVLFCDLTVIISSGHQISATGAQFCPFSALDSEFLPASLIDRCRAVLYLTVLRSVVIHLLLLGLALVPASNHANI